MRRYSLSLLATAAAISFSASVASAADLPRKAPAYVPPAPPPFSWTGFYIGGHGGGGWGTSETALNNLSFGPPINTSFPQGGNAFSQTQMNGWLAGGTIGYNWQVNPWLVLGIEGDFTWTDIKGTSPCTFEGLIVPFSATGSCSTKVKWTADLTGRVGFAVDRALLYVKGGVVWGKFDHAFNSNLPLGPGVSITTAFSESDTRVGGLLGAGIEYAFLPNWSAKIEYNFMDFGHSDRVFAGSLNEPGISFPLTADTNVRDVLHTVKVGVNYRFDWGRM